MSRAANNAFAGRGFETPGLINTPWYMRDVGCWQIGCYLLLPNASSASNRRCTQCELWPIRLVAVSPPGSFAPWLVRPRTWYHWDTTTKLYAYNLLFILFQGFLFWLRLYKERQLYNSIIKVSLFRQIRKTRAYGPMDQWTWQWTQGKAEMYERLKKVRKTGYVRPRCVGESARGRIV